MPYNNSLTSFLYAVLGTDREWDPKTWNKNSLLNHDETENREYLFSERLPVEIACLPVSGETSVPCLKTEVTSPGTDSLGEEQS